MARITGRTVLIVGASSGIGAEVARQLAGGGNRFVITARRAAELAAVAAEIRAAGRGYLAGVPAHFSPSTASASANRLS
ncbi:SDR family NAD(P)-dependent oxidoreductase [Streptomyces sp. NPDC005921]